MRISSVAKVGYLVVFLLCTFTSSFAQPDNLTKVRLQLKWKHPFKFAGYYAAIHQGFYSEEGLEVELLEAHEEEDTTKAVFDGRADFGVATSDVIIERAAGHPVVLLAPIFQHSSHVIVASAKAGINQAEDLVGKRVMMEPQAADLIIYLAEEGVSTDQYEQIPHTFNIQDLLDGDVDAMSAYLTDEPFVLQEAGFDYTVISPLAGGVDFYGDGLFTLQDMVEGDPELVSSFLRASLKGWKYAMDHTDEIIDLIHEQYSQRHSKEHLRYEAAQMRHHVMPDIIEIGQSLPGRWAKIIEIYKKAGIIPADINIEGLFYDEYSKNPVADQTVVPLKKRSTGLYLTVILSAIVIALILFRLRKKA